MAFDCVAQDRVVPAVRRIPNARELLGKPGAALDVGEEECDGASWRRRHHGLIDEELRR